MLQSFIGVGVGVGVGVGIGVGVGVGGGSSWPPCPSCPLLLVDVGLGAGVGIGVGVSIGAGTVVDEAVVNRGVVPVPRTQASGSVQGLLAEMGLPSVLQELLAACTRANRRLFKPASKETVP